MLNNNPNFQNKKKPNCAYKTSLLIISSAYAAFVHSDWKLLYNFIQYLYALNHAPSEKKYKKNERNTWGSISFNQKLVSLRTQFALEFLMA